jgi:hypothetical protein
MQDEDLANMLNDLSARRYRPALPPPHPTRTARPVTVELVESIVKAAVDVGTSGAFSCDDCFTTLDRCGAMTCYTGFVLRRLVDGGYLILDDEPQEKRGLAFAEALRALNIGQKVRRAAWGARLYVSFFAVENDFAVPRSVLTMDDIEADDWEIVQ